ncbi:MAG: hypothetical protein E6610_06535, partial [Clostridium perfringens]|nr:hypothetical protein [Clostridium perfringens]
MGINGAFSILFNKKVSRNIYGFGSNILRLRDSIRSKDFENLEESLLDTFCSFKSVLNDFGVPILSGVSSEQIKAAYYGMDSFCNKTASVLHGSITNLNNKIAENKELKAKKMINDGHTFKEANKVLKDADNYRNRTNGNNKIAKNYNNQSLNSLNKVRKINNKSTNCVKEFVQESSGSIGGLASGILNVRDNLKNKDFKSLEGSLVETFAGLKDVLNDFGVPVLSGLSGDQIKDVYEYSKENKEFVQESLGSIGDLTSSILNVRDNLKNKDFKSLDNSELSEEDKEKSEENSELSEEDKEKSEENSELSEEDKEKSEDNDKLSEEDKEKSEDNSELNEEDKEKSEDNSELSEEDKEKSEDNSELSEEDKEKSEENSELSEEDKEKSEDNSELNKEDKEKSEENSELSEE